ncbi:AraC family transcriptional regulator [Myroides pelagicus]|uniref:Helix-turn-helix domain-containing protein n=1 Tax=Myroides pelagicus TaxID=270914 RepID=A0A7K1GLF7_9FLAO|nr:AraC family transcriptional regulator [Myroides pelagicus]MTH29722.1 helix-turn-helix domain-containing protein [Myroides pelagicus]
MNRQVLHHVLLLFVLGMPFAKAEQQHSAADVILAKILTDVRPVDKDRAYFLVDSIYHNNSEPETKIHALFIHAYLYHDAFDVPHSLEKSFEAIALAEKHKAYKWLSRLYGFAGAEYSRLGLFTEAQLYFNKVEPVLPKIVNEKDRIFSTYYYYHLLSAFYFEQEKYEQSIESIEQSEDELIKIAPMLLHNSHYIVSDLQNKGLNYQKLKKYDIALDLYNQALTHLNKDADLAESLTAAYVYAGLGQVYLLERNPAQNKEIQAYLHKALSIAIQNNNRDLKKDTYLSLSEYYEYIGDLVNYRKYNKAFLNELETKQQFKETTIDQLLHKQYLLQNKIDNKNKNYFVIIITILGALVLVPIFILLKNRKSNSLLNAKKQNKDYLQQLTTCSRTDLPLHLPGVAWNTTVIAPDDTELTERLRQFEFSKGYLDSTLSLESLAKLLHTDSKSLNQVLKRYKNTDFKTYLSQLRLLAVIDMLRFEKKYRKYKIGHLATSVGYNSHSSFTVEFKKQIGVNPSFFIQYLKEIEHKPA